MLSLDVQQDAPQYSMLLPPSDAFRDINANTKV